MNLFRYKILGLYFFSCESVENKEYNKIIEEGLKNLEKNEKSERDEKFEKEIKKEADSSKENTTNITKEDFKNLIKYLEEYLKNYEHDDELLKKINPQFFKDISELKIDEIVFFEFIKKNNLKSLIPYIKYENPKGDGIPRVYELAENKEIESQVDRKFGKKDEVYKLEFNSEREINFDEKKYPNYSDDSEFVFQYDVFDGNIEFKKKGKIMVNKYSPFSLEIYFNKNKAVLVRKKCTICYREEKGMDNTFYNTTISTDNLLKVE